MLQRGHSSDGSDSVLTFCKFDLRNGDLPYSLLMLVEDAIGDPMEDAYSRAGLITAR